LTAPAAGPADPLDVLRSPRYLALLAAASVVGLVISLLAWGFLELISEIQEGVFTDLPDGLGFDGAPSWWPLPVLVLAGLPVAVALRLPGEGGHVPAGGLQMGMTTPDMLPGVLLAALATLGLGAVLGPEGPLIALGGGATLLLVGLVRRDAPEEMRVVLAAAGTFAAISMIFQSPVVAAVLVIEATGLGGPTLPVVLLPGLLAAGIGSLTFIGVSGWIGLDTSAYSLAPLALDRFPRPTLGDLAWTLLLAVVAAVVVQVVRRLGLRAAPAAARRPFLVVPVAGAVVALLAIAFAEVTDHAASEVLFSGQDQLPGLVADAGSWSMGALGLVLVGKGLAWAVCLGTFRGGPTFPALYPAPPAACSPATSRAWPRPPPSPSGWRPWRPPCSGCRCRRPSSPWPSASRAVPVRRPSSSSPR
jgi:H+/Cl- antiporter ClcA